MTLDVILGYALDEARVTELDDLAEGASSVGTLAVGPGGLLRDLELRLGLTADDTPPPVRVARYAQRLKAVALSQTLPPFWSASFAKDPLGTAREVLRWRDELVLAGWNGNVLANGGPRLEALASVEAIGGGEHLPSIPTLSAGESDRWRSVQDGLYARAHVQYATIRVVDPVALFPRRIRDVLDQLAAQGVKVVAAPCKPSAVPRDSDLGRLQEHLAGNGDAPFTVRGDGSLVILEAETATELGGATAARLSGVCSGESAVVVRISDPGPLDYALRAAGLATQGLSSASPLRPSFQVLPLALELAYEPKDPSRILELLTLPGGPFDGGLGRNLAEAFAGCPGLGNSDWEQAKRHWANQVRKNVESRRAADEGTPGDDDEAEGTEIFIATRLQRVKDWIEAPGATEPRAPRAKLFEVVARVQKWLAGRVAHPAAENSELGALEAQAYVQAGTLVLALGADPRDALTIVEIRQLLAESLGGGVVTQLCEQAGRIDHVTDPAALLRPRDTVVFWGAVDVGTSIPNSPWSPSERSALVAAGIELPDHSRLLEYRAESARRALLFAARRVIVARPLTQLGEDTAPHPLLDEIYARLGGSREDIARVTTTARALLDGDKAEALLLLPLPSARPTWAVTPGQLQPRDHLSPSAMEILIGCPLRYVLEKEAGLRDSSLVSLPSDHNLFGSIGHRLVEKLFEQGLIGEGTPANQGRLLEAATAILDLLLREEATPLLIPGRGDECAQYRQRVLNSVCVLDELLRRSRLTVVGVEEVVEIEWNGRRLEGRLDLLLNDSAGKDVVLDLKWGSTSYAQKLEQGSAIQLATYAFVRSQQIRAKQLPEAGYFSLRKGEAIALSGDVFLDSKVIEGPDLELTWKRTAASVAALEADLASGCIAVPGVLQDTPAWRLGARAQANAEDFVPLATDAACEYCTLDALCGRRWLDSEAGEP